MNICGNLNVMKYKLILFQERLDTMRERKDGLKHQLADIQSELEESKKAHR